MDEEKIFEAFGIAPEDRCGSEQKNGGTAEQVEEQAGELGDRTTEKTEEETFGGTKGQEESDAPSAETDGEHEPASETDQQTEEQRRENAAKRRRQEQQAAIDQAVSAALEQERGRVKEEWSAFFAKAGLKNSITGEPITTLDEFNAWSRAYDAARLSQDLKEGKLTPEALDKAIAGSPAIKQAEEMVRHQEEEKRRQAEEAAKARIDAEIREIHKLDSSISDMADLLKMPNARQFYEYVKKGNSFLDAWYLANREELEQKTAQAAKQQALNAARSKEHLKATANARGTGAASVPPEEMRLFRLFNPDATEAEIQAYYNKQKKG